MSPVSPVCCTTLPSCDLGASYRLNPTFSTSSLVGHDAAYGNTIHAGNLAFHTRPASLRTSGIDLPRPTAHVQAVQGYGGCFHATETARSRQPLARLESHDAIPCDDGFGGLGVESRKFITVNRLPAARTSPYRSEPRSQALGQWARFRNPFSDRIPAIRTEHRPGRIDRSADDGAFWRLPMLALSGPVVH